MIKTCELYDLDKTMAAPLLKETEYPWEALPEIGAFILEIGQKLPKDEYTWISGNVWVAKDAEIYPNTNISGPCIIGHNTEIRPGAFIRGNALIGDDCVVGNSTELKNVILFDGVQVPHFNYVGDSILGYKAHMGAGSITSNVKADKAQVVVKEGEKLHYTGRKKVGAMLGDHAEIGCNAVLNPGSVVCRNSNVYPTSCVRGVVPPESIWKVNGEIVAKKSEND